MSHTLSVQDEIEKDKILEITIDDLDLLESFALGAIAARVRDFEQPMNRILSAAIKADLPGVREDCATLAALHIESRADTAKC